MSTRDKDAPRPVLASNWIGSVCVGQLVEWNDDEGILVDFPGNTRGPLVAKMAGSLSFESLQQTLHDGQPVILAFEKNNHDLPVIIDTVTSSAKINRFCDVDETQVTEFDKPIRSHGKVFGSAPAQLAKIVFFHQDELYIDFDGNPGGPLKARTTIPIRNANDIVVVTFLSDGYPVIIGQLCDASDPSEVVITGERVRIEASQGITLVTDQSQIHLDARGKITTVADTIVSRARGTNKVQGGSVHLN